MNRISIAIFLLIGLSVVVDSYGNEKYILPRKDCVRQVVPYDRDVAWIENDTNTTLLKGPYVDTLIPAVGNPRLEAEIMPVSLGGSEAYLGSYTEANKRFLLIAEAKGKIGIGSKGSFTFGNLSTNEISHVVLDSFSNPPMASIGSITNKTSFTKDLPSGNIYLFARNGGEYIGSNHGRMRLYWCKIWSSGVLVRDYVPVVKKIEGVDTAYLYDRVSRRLFFDGTGAFKWGEK